MPNGRLKQAPGTFETISLPERTGTLNQPTSKVLGSRQAVGTPKAATPTPAELQYERAMSMGMRDWNNQPGRIEFMYNRPEIKGSPYLQGAFKRIHLQQVGRPYVPKGKKR